MKTFCWLPLAALLVSCNTAAFNAVGISPIYGWADGCTDVKVSGSGFDEDIAVTLDMGGGASAALDSLVHAVDDPALDARLQALEEGYYVLGRTPAAPTGTNGFADVVVTSGGETDTVVGAFYYVACPAPGYIEASGPSEGLTAGTQVAIAGCGLDTTALRAQLVDASGQPAGDAVALQSDCGTAQVHFAAPDLPAGSYYLALVDSGGTIVSGGPCPVPDTGDTGYTSSYCYEFPLTYGGAK